MCCSRPCEQWVYLLEFIRSAALISLTLVLSSAGGNCLIVALNFLIYFFINFSSEEISCDACSFSVLICSRISLRNTSMFFGALMPIFTWSFFEEMMVISISSPILMLSPFFLVSTSIFPHPFTSVFSKIGCFVLNCSLCSITCLALRFFKLMMTGAWRFAVVFSKGS